MSTTVDLSTYGGLLRDIGYAGDIADLNNYDTLTLSNEGANPIIFGNAVMRGSAEGTCVAVDGTASRAILGLAMRQPLQPADANQQAYYVTLASVPIMLHGDMICVASENVVRDDPVLAVTTLGASASPQLGGVSAGAASGTRLAVPNAKWLNATTAGSKGRVRITS